MKKTLSLLLVCLMLLSLVGCGGAGGGSKKPATIADDRSIYEMRITAPEEYDTIERFTDKLASGEISEKDINFTLADGSKISYGCMKGRQLSDFVDLSTLESKEIGGQTYYFIDRQGDYCAFAQRENDLYAVQYTPAEGGDGALLDEIVAALTYAESDEPVVDDTDLYDISYTLDDTLAVAGYNVDVEASSEGEVKEKSVLWKFGEDADDPDFRFSIGVIRGRTLESVLKEDKEYETKTVGDNEFTVLVTDDDAPYEYYIQHGDDVYEIRNSGKSGWFVTRSEESVAAFEKLLGTVSFK